MSARKTCFREQTGKREPLSVSPAAELLYFTGFLLDFCLVHLWLKHSEIYCGSAAVGPRNLQYWTSGCGWGLSFAPFWRLFWCLFRRILLHLRWRCLCCHLTAPRPPDHLFLIILPHIYLRASTGAAAESGFCLVLVFCFPSSLQFEAFWIKQASFVLLGFWFGVEEEVLIHRTKSVSQQMFNVILVQQDPKSTCLSSAELSKPKHELFIDFPACIILNNMLRCVTIMKVELMFGTVLITEPTRLNRFSDPEIKTLIFPFSR